MGTPCRRSPAPEPPVCAPRIQKNIYKRRGRFKKRMREKKEIEKWSAEQRKREKECKRERDKEAVRSGGTAMSLWSDPSLFNVLLLKSASIGKSAWYF